MRKEVSEEVTFELRSGKGLGQEVRVGSGVVRQDHYTKNAKVLGQRW